MSLLNMPGYAAAAAQDIIIGVGRENQYAVGCSYLFHNHYCIGKSLILPPESGRLSGASCEEGDARRAIVPEKGLHTAWAGMWVHEQGNGHFLLGMKSKGVIVFDDPYKEDSNPLPAGSVQPGYRSGWL